MALVAHHPAFVYDRQRRDNPGGSIVDTVQAVFQALFATESFAAQAEALLALALGYDEAAALTPPASVS